LVDGGPDPVLLTSRLGQVLPFWQRRIDLVVATHADQDHLAGLVPVIERYRVPLVLEPPRMDDCSLAAHWRTVLVDSHTEVVQASRGMQIRFGKGLRLDVLHPRAEVVDDVAFDDNENSLVLRVVMGHRTMLLTADIGEQGEGDLLASGVPVRAELLKVAHHGAASSSSAAFLAAVDPQIAVISMEADSRFGHPSEEVLARLSAADCRVFRTDQDGTIEFITDGQRCWVKLHR
jgi:competence protein ComEC